MTEAELMDQVVARLTLIADRDAEGLYLPRVRRASTQRSGAGKASVRGKLMPSEQPSWRDQALCAHATGDWVGPTKGRKITAMREQRRNELAVCDACPVKTECLEYGMTQTYGIFGGLLPAERAKLRRKK